MKSSPKRLRDLTFKANPHCLKISLAFGDQRETIKFLWLWRKRQKSVAAWLRVRPWEEAKRYMIQKEIRFWYGVDDWVKGYAVPFISKDTLWTNHWGPETISSNLKHIVYREITCLLLNIKTIVDWYCDRLQSKCLVFKISSHRGYLKFGSLWVYGFSASEKTLK